MHRTDKVTMAANYIEATQYGNQYKYYAAETGEWYQVTDDDLVHLADLILDKDHLVSKYAYSHWCASGCGSVCEDPR